MSALHAIEHLLNGTIGLDASSIGSPAVERAVRTRKEARALRDTAAYLDLVRTSREELQELIEAVVVPETSFFRDRGAFVALHAVVQERRLPNVPSEPLRILSVPCSTGEEPYTIAMTLLDAGLHRGNAHVDAVDISARALAHAKHGFFGPNAFRGTDLAFRDRHFTPSGARYRVNDAVRALVQFQRGNLLALDVVTGGAVYDVVFCRNLLIYFDAKTQERAVLTLRRLLKPGGLLFVGPAESPAVVSHCFSPLGLPASFAFRRDDERRAAAQEAAPRRAPRSAKPARAPAPLRIVAPRTKAPSAPAAAAPADLTEATRLADQGRLADAADACERYLRANGPSAAAFHLLGLIHSASDEPHAADVFFRKALYLEPRSAETLAHLAALREQLGDSAAARALRVRLQRLLPRTGTDA